MEAVKDQRFELCYNRKPYCKSLKTKLVTSVILQDALWLVLADSCFYPEGGGQPGDRGQLVVPTHQNDVKEPLILEVTDTRMMPEGIAHRLAKEPQELPMLAPGTHIVAKVDWPRRYEMMQQHSAEHLISGLIHQAYGYQNVGFHINDELMTLDFNGPLSAEDIAQIEEKAQACIYENLPLSISYPQADDPALPDYRSKLELAGQLRLVEVPDVDRCACCGTHVRTTGEIGSILIVDAIHYKGGMRLTALAGQRAWRHARRLQMTQKELSQQLSSPTTALPEAVSALLQRFKGLESQVAELRRTLLGAYLNRLDPLPCERLSLVTPGLSASEASRLCQLLRQQGAAWVACLIPQEDSQVFLCAIQADESSMPAELLALQQHPAFRGGGRKGQVSGRWSAGLDAWQAFGEPFAISLLNLGQAH